RLCAAGGLSQMKGCNPRLKYVAKPVSVDEEAVGSGLQFVTAVQLRLIVIAADGLESPRRSVQKDPSFFFSFLAFRSCVSSP
ncbi:hypothetical protein KUCAC02_036126, partial [Chaenocephalus aceratus]